jgi:hypothetical protein
MLNGKWPLKGAIMASSKVNYVYSGDVGASSQVTDVIRYVIVRKLLKFMFCVLPVFLLRVGNSNVCTHDFPCVRLHAERMT